MEIPAQAPHWLLKEWQAAGRAERISGTAQVNQEAANSFPPVQGFQAGKQTNSLHIYIPFLPIFWIHFLKAFLFHIGVQVIHNVMLVSAV